MAGKRRRRRGAGIEAAAMPSITSLMDIITIILVYLIKTMASSPISVQDPSIQLPISTSVETVQDLVVVMITGAERRDTGPRGEKIFVPDVPTIVVDDDVIMQLSQDFEVPAGELERQFVIRKLKQRLLEVRKMQGVTAELTEKGEGFTGKVVFVVDKNVPYRTLSKALVSSAEAGYADFKFAIVKSEG
jgi:biopolymer transport protein ExbD